ncbi:MAG: hypothetical protein ACFB9M_04890 [Myxococcota bacterium]
MGSIEGAAIPPVEALALPLGLSGLQGLIRDFDARDIEGLERWAPYTSMVDELDLPPLPASEGTEPHMLVLIQRLEALSAPDARALSQHLKFILHCQWEVENARSSPLL